MLNEIIKWVENKPHFWKVSIDRLIQNNELSKEDITEIKEICKIDAGISKIKYEPVNFEELRKIGHNFSQKDNIIISNILNVENINALSNTSNLEFAKSGITAVYGDNGTGKSSYVSILKHACNTRGAKPKIYGNLYNSTTFKNDKKAEIIYEVNGNNPKSVFFSNEKISDSILKKVNIFDTSSAIHYIENEDEIAFIPQGLSLLEKFGLSLEEIENNFTDDILKLNLEKYDYQEKIEVPEDSTAKIFLNNFNSKTTLKELRSEAKWSTDIADRINVLNSSIGEIKSTDPKKVLKNNNEKKSRFEIVLRKLKKIEDALSSDSLVEYKRIIKEFIDTNKALEDVSVKIFNNDLLDGIGSSTWKLLWESARKFYNESKKMELFPNVGDVCPLCLQELSLEAKKQFCDFERFMQNEIQEKFNSSSANHIALINKLNNLIFDFSDQEPIISELEEYISEYRKYLSEYIDKSIDFRNKIVTFHSNYEIGEELVNPVFSNNPIKKVEDIIANIIDDNRKLETESVQGAVVPLEKELNQLIGQKKIFENRIYLVKELYRLKRIDDLNSCIKKCKTNSITTLSNEMATNYVEIILKEQFKSELQKLGFNNLNIETETRGSKAKQYHFLKLNEVNSNNISLKDILSEGEHRCISLATFLSELAIAEHKSCIILDDPVSSLDHKWRNRIAKRITEEAKLRQVIVFTHDITFLLMLQEQSEKQVCDLKIKNLTRKKMETGLVSDHLPWDALTINKRISELNSEMQLLERVEQNETEEIYNDKVKTFYGKLRESWERLVEELLLNKVIQRFGREIQTNRLKLLSDLCDDDYKIIDTNMSKCSTYFLGHDTSGTLIECPPSLSEVKEDLQAIKNYVKDLRKRKRN